MNDADFHERLDALRAGRVPEDELYGLIHDFGEAQFTTAERVVAQYLKHQNADLRYIALSVLTLHWDMRSYRQECERLVVEDSDPYVRGMAAAGLGYILRQTRDAQATEFLLRRVHQPDEDGLVRSSAYQGLLDLWLPQSGKTRAAAMKTWLGEVEASDQRIRRMIEVSTQLDEAKAAGDEGKVGELSREMAALTEAEEGLWERGIDWDLVAAIERGEIVE